MSLSALSSCLPLIPSVGSPVAVSTAKDEVTPIQPLDLLIISSRSDFFGETNRLLDEANRKGLHVETLFIEDLQGDNAGMRLCDLHQRMGTLTTSGKLSDSSATYVSLHGVLQGGITSMRHLGQLIPGIDGFMDFLDEKDQSASATFSSSDDNEPVPAATSGHASANETDGEDEDVSASASVSDNESAEESEQSSDDASGPDEPEQIHLMGTYDKKICFPSELFCLALGQAHTEGGDDYQLGYKGPVLLGCCFAGKLIDRLAEHGGSYLLLSGKKPGLTSDSKECMSEVLDMMANQKRTLGPVPTTLDYLTRLGQISGENIAYVENGDYLVHKALDSGANMLEPAEGRAAKKADRVLEAKLSHGSAKALEAVFERFGADSFLHHRPKFFFDALAMDDIRDQSVIEEKLRVLEKHGILFPQELVDADEAAELLKLIIELEGATLLLILLSQRPEGYLTPALLASMGDCIFDLDDSDTPQALQRMCEANTALETAVTAWIIEGLKWSREHKRPTVMMNHQPYFLERVFAESITKAPDVLRDAFQRHSQMLIEREHTGFTANLDKDTFIHDPGQWLSDAFVRALLHWQDLQEAEALMSVVAKLKTPLTLRQTLDMAGRVDNQQEATVIEFLRARGFTVDF